MVVCIYSFTYLYIYLTLGATYAGGAMALQLVRSSTDRAVLVRPFTDCARKMLESCSRECRTVAKKLPKIQKVAT